MKQASRRKHHYIYKTTCTVTGRWYIGMHSTDDLEDGYIGSGTDLARSIRRHGIENHECQKLEFYESRDALKRREAELVTEAEVADLTCMNMTIGGGGGWSSAQMKKLWSNPEYVAKQKARPYHAHTDELKASLSTKGKAQWEDAEYRAAKIASTKAINSTEEYKAKQRASWTDERRQKHSALMSERMKGSGNPNFKRQH